MNTNMDIYSALIGGKTKEMQEWNGMNERKFYTFEFCYLNTLISNKSGFILFLLQGFYTKIKKKYRLLEC